MFFAAALIFGILMFGCTQQPAPAPTAIPTVTAAPTQVPTAEPTMEATPTDEMPPIPPEATPTEEAATPTPEVNNSGGMDYGYGYYQ